MGKGLRTLDGLRVLVVEDDDDTREVLTLGLSLYGADVVAVSCAADAMAELERALPDVIVSDIGLPDEDGLALIRRVRRLPPNRGGRVPAVAVTAFTLSDDAEEATRAGFQRHFRKPVETAGAFQRRGRRRREGAGRAAPRGEALAPGSPARAAVDTGSAYGRAAHRRLTPDALA